jgi:hypothetical protein
MTIKEKAIIAEQTILRIFGKILEYDDISEVINTPGLWKL